MTETSNLWYIRKPSGSKEGGFTDHELIALLRQGVIGPEDEIWTLSMKNWMSVRETIYSFYLPEEEQDLDELPPIEVHPQKDPDPQLDVLKIKTMPQTDEFAEVAQEIPAAEAESSEQE